MPKGDKNKGILYTFSWCTWNINLVSILPPLLLLDNIEENEECIVEFLYTI